MENEIDQIHQQIKKLFSEAVSVRIFVSCEGIEVTPEYRTNISGYSMQNINGEWVRKQK